MNRSKRFRPGGRSRSADEAARAVEPEKYVELSGGTTYYELGGPPDGQTVVLVHGFSVPCYIWDPTFQALAEAGFRVLRYDLYGRGRSDRPVTVYDQELFDRQLLDLLAALELSEPVDLCGLSMGGPITIVFTDRHPERVRKLCLFDPAGFPFEAPAALRLLSIPVVGECLMGLLGRRFLVSGLADDLYRPEGFPEYVEQYLPQFKRSGFRRALLSTMRSGMLGDQGEAYRRVGKQQRPVLLVWGRHDRVIPLASSDQVRKAIPHVEFHVIDEAGHIAHYERPEVVNPLLIEFLSR